VPLHSALLEILERKEICELNCVTAQQQTYKTMFQFAKQRVPCQFVGFYKDSATTNSASCLQQVRDEWEIIPSSASRSDVVKLSNGTEVQLFPSSQPHHGHVNETRRKLGDFQQCSPCTCCDRTRSWCIPLVCCYNIQCDLEGLPFGLCSFIPISCTCFGCST
jgi:hypothetical protein